MRVRIFNIAQYEKNPETGKHLIDEKQIIEGLKHTSIKKWAYILHDRDKQTQKDVDDYKKRNPNKKVPFKVGDPKPRHWHVVLNTPYTAYDPKTIAEWFGIEMQYVDCPKGRGAFLDCVQYLTHERTEQQKIGKRLYKDSEVHCSDGFDFRAEIEKREADRLKYGGDLDDKDKLRFDVLYQGLSLKDARKKNPIEYMNDVTYLKKLRMEYISNVMPMPPVRLNFYINGPSGFGKSIMSRGLAHMLCDPKGDLTDDYVFFEVGSTKTTFDGYDGQPVIIWDDCRASDIIERLGDRGNVFNVFDCHPENIVQNIKYSFITLKNQINIVNGIEPWEDFRKELAGEEDENQISRRFPFWIVLEDNAYNLNVNIGLYNDIRDYSNYVQVAKNRGKMQDVVDKFGTAKDRKNKKYVDVTSKFLKPIKAPVERVVNTLESHERNLDDNEYTPDELEFISTLGITEGGVKVVNADGDVREIRPDDYEKLGFAAWDERHGKRQKQDEIEYEQASFDDDLTIKNMPNEFKKGE